MLCFCVFKTLTKFGALWAKILILLKPTRLHQFLNKKRQTKVYLETNATLSNNLEKIKNLIDIISADIKLETSTGLNTFDKHREFFTHCNGIETFAKIVFDKNITEEEIKTCAEIGNEFNIELVLQPKMIEDKMSVNSDFCNELLEKFTALHHNTRLIPQVHKFLDVR